MIKIKKIILVFLLLVINLGFGNKNLENKLGKIQNLSADFEQSVYNQKNKLIKKEAGTLQIKKPKKFIWQTEKPLSMLIVSNGKLVWNYDKDLDQVVIRKFPEENNGLPVRFLTDNTSNLNKEFKIKEINKNLFELEPYDDISPFRNIKIYFNAKNNLEKIILIDQMDQKIILLLSKLDFKSELKNSLFEFSPPPGVDVLTAY